MPESLMSNPAHVTAAKTYKRLIAIIYDSFLALAVLMFASAVPLFFTGGESVKAASIFMSLYLLLVLFLFFAWFWTRGGQTLGMQAWRIKLVQKNNTLINWQQALLRFVLALPAWSVIILGVVLSFRTKNTGTDSILAKVSTIPAWVYLCIGIIWLVLDNIPNNWREKLSRTSVVQLPK